MLHFVFMHFIHFELSNEDKLSSVYRLYFLKHSYAGFTPDVKNRVPRSQFICGKSSLFLREFASIRIYSQLCIDFVCLFLAQNTKFTFGVNPKAGSFST